MSLCIRCGITLYRRNGDGIYRCAPCMKSLSDARTRNSLRWTRWLALAVEYGAGLGLNNTWDKGLWHFRLGKLRMEDYGR